jgi:hypothetical protein
MLKHYNIKPILGKFIAGDFIAIAGEMRRFLASPNSYQICIILQSKC